ncbi:MAG TPA: TolC family outer membrane protein [Nevskiaceae bacterium]|nr:TolC family outer membrane protein [Nevskiaceae bacterium]
MTWREWVALAMLALAAAPAAQAMTLSEAYALALQHDPAVAESLGQYKAEREPGDQERSTLYPNVSVAAGAAYDRTDSTGVFGHSNDTYPSYSATLKLRQPLFRLDWFARGARADARDASADASLAQRKLDLLQQVAQRYFDVLTAQDGLAQTQAEARAVRESFDATRKRYEVELAPGTDLKEAQARNDLAGASMLAARRTLEAALDALDESTGNGRAALPRLPAELRFPPLLPADAESWIASGREHSPKLLLAQQQLAIARADLTSRKSEATPTVDLVGSYGRDDTSRYVFGQKVDDGRVGLELNIPLYAGGYNASRVREAQGRLEQAQSALARTQADLERDIRARLRDVQLSMAQIDAYEKQLGSAQVAQQATANGYEAGTRTISDVLDAKSRVVQAQRDLNQSRYSVLLNLLLLKQAVGVLSEKDFAEIDRLLAQGTAASTEQSP